MGEFDPDDLIARRRKSSPLFGGSKRDSLTGDYVAAPSLPEGEDATEFSAPEARGKARVRPPPDATTAQSTRAPLPPSSEPASSRGRSRGRRGRTPHADAWDPARVRAAREQEEALRKILRAPVTESAWEGGGYRVHVQWRSGRAHIVVRPARPGRRGTLTLAAHDAEALGGAIARALQSLR